MANKSIRLSDGTDTLYPESAVYGSNTNGAYVKFADGTLMQWATKVTSIQSGVQKIITETFPIAFVGTSITAFVNPLTSSATIRTSVKGYTTTTMDVCIYDTIASTERYYNWIAIGRWK